jgi:hypothetical protein
MQALAGDGRTDDAIATALSPPPRTVKRLKLCSTILPAILDHMASGDEPQAALHWTKQRRPDRADGSGASTNRDRTGKEFCAR